MRVVRGEQGPLDQLLDHPAEGEVEGVDNGLHAATLRALHALEQTLSSSNADALETLIDQASQARAHWRMSTNKPKS